MPKEFDFEFVEEHVRKKTYGVFSTIDKKGRPHSTGILYGVAPPESQFALYMLTGSHYVKTKNVQRDPNVSLVVNFPHYWFRFAPDSYVMFRGKAETVPFEDPDGQWAFKQKRILRFNLDTDPEEAGEMVFIKLVPEPKVFVYGLGFSLMEMRDSHTDAGYKVTVPEDRR